MYLMGYMLSGYMLVIMSAGTLPTIKGGGRGLLEAWLHSMRSVRKLFTPFKRQKRVVVRHVTSEDPLWWWLPGNRNTNSQWDRFKAASSDDFDQKYELGKKRILLDSFICI